MLNKENNIIFLQAIQEKQYNKAYKIGSQILNKNPNEQSIKRFMIFLQNNLQDQEDDEEEEYEYEDEKEYEQKRQKVNKKIQPIMNKPQRNKETKNTLDIKNKQIEIPVKAIKQYQQIRNVKQTNKISIKQLNKPSEVQQIKTTVPQISIQFPSLVRK
ncbi:unnamed protein product [Paramecium pentaurelia]|uniref:Uncharacterized protein n=1 Tax=Paramecium pentaurelia TaxID=43138 RepID=A0A8S1U7I0_9CILI|nr:unnamed protein product [Paramecium pentaurelia]